MLFFLFEVTCYKQDVLGSVPFRGRNCNLCHHVHTSSGTHPASCPVGTGSVSRWVMLSDHHTDVFISVRSWGRMRRDLPPPSGVMLGHFRPWSYLLSLSQSCSHSPLSHSCTRSPRCVSVALYVAAIVLWKWVMARGEVEGKECVSGREGVQSVSKLCAGVLFSIQPAPFRCDMVQ
jgi:hypothetical protein